MNELIYTIRIIRCSNPETLWYRDLAGQDLECRLIKNNTRTWPGLELYETVNDYYHLPGSTLPPKPGYLLPEDCKVLFTLNSEA